MEKTEESSPKLGPYIWGCTNRFKWFQRWTRASCFGVIGVLFLIGLPVIWSSVGQPFLTDSGIRLMHGSNPTVVSHGVGPTPQTKLLWLQNWRNRHTEFEVNATDNNGNGKGNASNTFEDLWHMMYDAAEKSRDSDFNITAGENSPSLDLNTFEKKTSPGITNEDSDFRNGLFSVWNRDRQKWENLKLPPLPPLTFSPGYKNPCWMESGDFSRLRCLPFYYLIGQAKCGSTDLAAKLWKHSKVAKPRRKGTHWWSRRRFGIGSSAGLVQSFDDYLNNFDPGVVEILKYDKDLQPLSVNDIVLGDASVSMLTETRVKGRRSQSSRQLVPRTLRQMQPGAKIIVILRNPIDRLFSATAYFNNLVDLEKFHQFVVKELSVFKQCLSTEDLWSCSYNPSGDFARLIRGLYYPFLFDWLQVFPRDQIKVIRLEDYSRDRVTVLNEIYRFLGLDNLSAESAAQLQNDDVANRGQSRKPMLDETRALLEEFYQPYNEKLATLLRDERYLWKD